MVWIHGGALKNKSGGPDNYNATKLVEHSVAIGRPVVVVNVTYRLNVFGFFSSSDLKKDVEKDGEDVYGSWGIDDTCLAVQWVGILFFFFLGFTLTNAISPFKIEI